MEPVHQVVVAAVPARRGEMPQSVEGLLAHHNGDPVGFPEAGELGGQPCKLPAQALHLPIGDAGGPVVAQHALPEGFQPRGEGNPGPVHHAGGPGGNVAEGHQTELSRIGQPAGAALGLTFQHQVVAASGQGAHHVPGKGDFPPGQAVGAGAVDVCSHQSQGLGGGELVHIRLNPLGVAPLFSRGFQRLPVEVEVVGDELVLPFQLRHQFGLPFQEVRRQAAAVGLEGAGVAGAGGGGGVGQLLEGDGGVAPVVHPVGGVEGGDIRKAVFHPLAEAGQHPLALHAVVFCLVVQLVADDVGISRRPGHGLPDDLLRAAAVDGVGQIKILPRAEAVAVQNAGGELRQPAGNGIGGGAYDDPDVPRRRGLDHRCDMGKIIDAVGGLRHGPGGFADADGVDPRLLHQLHVLVHPAGGEIFLIVRRAEYQFIVLFVHLFLLCAARIQNCSDCIL